MTRTAMSFSDDPPGRALAGAGGNFVRFQGAEAGFHIRHPKVRAGIL